MDWRAIGRRWGRGIGLGSAKGAPADPEPRRLDEWTACLAAAGVPAELATRLAPDLAAAQHELGRGSAPGLIRGAVLAATLQAESQARVERSLRDVREVERLLGAFSGELEKLDEVLEVLAAYAQRMRPQAPAGPTRRTLH